MATLIDLTGQKFGRLTVVRRGANRGEKVRWVCKCECGGKGLFGAHDLASGKTRGCGCLRVEALRERAIARTVTDPEILRQRRERKTELQYRRHLRDKYGLSLEAYAALLQKQNGCCAICSSKEKRLNIDHCHKSRKLRALLCGPCNRLLGLAKENPEI